MNRLLSGAVAGAVAALPMTAVMEALHQRLRGEVPRPLPPREVAEGLAVKAGVRGELSERDLQNLTLTLHFAYAAFAGAVFGAVAPKHRTTVVGVGASYGLAVWAASYLGWLPAFGVRHPITYDPVARTRLMVASHLVWGLSMGALMVAARDLSRQSSWSEARA